MSRRSAAVGVVLAALALAGCGVAMPRSGPVVETTSTATRSDNTSVNINPRRPGKGDSPEQIVKGFLEAMTATPAVRTSVAREFLTDQARAIWQPAGMVIYGPPLPPHGTNQVELTLVDADQTDPRGAWLGPLPEDQMTVTFSMELEDGEWRISGPPPWLLVPRSWFEQRFRQVSLYFFDPSATVLVPEPVFVPRGPQFASTLVNGLLQGPSGELSELTFFPPKMRSVVSVPVTAAGVAQVDLTSDSENSLPAPQEAELLVSQLAWTLRQDPTIERFRITIGGQQVQLPNGESEFSVLHGRDYAPYVAGASTLLYGLRDGQLVAGSPENLDPVGGPFGQPDYPLRAVSPDLLANRVAGVSTDGSTLWIGPVNETDEAVTKVTDGGQDLLDPAWDFSGRLWEVDRTAEGAVVQYLRGTKLRTFDVPGISGEDVKDFLVSRDGSRLVAVIRKDRDNDAIVVSRILTTGDGLVVRALAAQDITAPDQLAGKIRDIAWRTPTGLVVLHPISRRLFQVRSASVDGASIGFDSLAVTIDDAVLGLAGTPTPDESSYAVVGGELIDLAVPRADRIDLHALVTSLGYAG